MKFPIILSQADSDVGIQFGRYFLELFMKERRETCN
jgi:hypothetical protein